MSQPNHSLEHLLEAIRRESSSQTAELLLDPLSTLPEKPLPSTPITAITTGGLPVLLAIQDEGLFIESAYQQLLARPADSEGKAHHLQLLQQGVPRSRLLFDLQFSAEAVAKGKMLPGLERFTRLYTHRWLKRFPRLQTRLCRTLERHMRASAPTLAASEANRALQQQLSDTRALIQYLHDSEQSARDMIRPVTGKLHMLELEMERLRLRSTNADITQPTSLAQADESDAEAFYLAFENACRGSEDAIREQFNTWLDHLPPSNNNGSLRILDIGCGRGEWLQLLSQHGYQPYGVDTNAIMIQHCRQKGLDVKATDALQWLKQQPDNSLCAVTAFHVVEHIPFELLLQWTREAYRALQPGGVLIYETPNPENILVASHTFYHDPTHRNPLTPTLLEFLAGYCGFDNAELVRLHPYPEEARLPGDDPLTARFNGHFCGPQDIGLVATKAREVTCV
ncbi:class I SAM-dependent methyltransferase [Marinobacterium weihaiense]|uniref:Methyltransferase domain-containing protein n=1 Tax=Marinobacterium weihaiense TaxID=2851016 RepID=A0ABS6M7N8_9GAMM|nr:class I SAM-dependent methyltransferase [Marinobacterium weihaiense]MBV0932302.1 methyltransferase domain-containing protein [Marinobacterium weihaiense]